jgi:hypothetical protein
MHKDILAYGEYQKEAKTRRGISDTGHAFMPLFDELGIDLVLTGHMHSYRNRGHIYQLRPSADKGPLYIMSGPIGNQHYHLPADNQFDRSAIYQPTPDNYLILRANQEKLTVTCYTIAGEHVETTEIVHT